jgi:hypothetical protein
MNVLTQETPVMKVIQKPEPDSIGEGSKLHTTYFEVRVTMPVTIEVAAQELSTDELLVAAEKAGTFAFLDAPEEDGYNDLRESRE